MSILEKLRHIAAPASAASVSAVCALLVSTSPVSAQDSIYTQSYKPNNTMTVQWCTDANAVRFQIQAKVTGWVGIGFGADRTMPSTDVYLFTGEGKTFDGFATAQAAPAKDAQQDITLISNSQASGVTTVEFSRPINTGDTKDFALSSNRYMLWAYHSTNDSFTAQHSNEGASNSINFSTAAACKFPVVYKKDVNGDGVVDVNDINALTAAIRAGSMAADANGDGSATTDDIGAYLKDAFNSYIGDSDMDGQFGSSDLVAIFIAGEYEDNLVGNSLWQTGDWNGDTEFNSDDLVFSFIDGSYEIGPRPVAVAAVPEPSTAVLFGLGTLLLCGRRRSSKS